MIWHNSKPQDVLNEFKVDDKIGLANGVVDERLEEYGQNIATKIEKPTFLKLLLNQLKNKSVIALIIIAVVSFIVALMYNSLTYYQPLLIIAIVAVNSVISAYTIYNSDNVLERIKDYTNPTVSVLISRFEDESTSALIPKFLNPKDNNPRA